MDRQIVEHFHQRDKILHRAYQNVGQIEKLEPAQQDEYFVNLSREIVYQQLSDKAGDTIYGRFEQLFENGHVTPQAVLETPHQKIRGAGISNAKVNYIKNLAEHVVKKKLAFNRLPEMSDDQVIAELILVKGIGRWTAEMFLMFSLAREDIFSHGDQGLRNAIVKLYNLPEDPPKEQIELISSRWSPYRTYACRILWKTLSL